MKRSTSESMARILFAMIIILWLCSEAFGQKGNFKRFSDLEGEFEVTIKADVIHVCHGAYKWLERINPELTDSTTKQSITYVTTDDVKWVCYYDRFESGVVNKKFFSDIWVDYGNGTKGHYFNPRIDKSIRSYD